MPRRNSNTRVARQVMELAFAAPQVVAHRTARMARAGARPTARDRAEFTRMGTEKFAAFCSSWAAMWGAMYSAQFEMMSKVMAAGLAPVHTKAVANARRLGRRRG
ncbi:MAG TPA: hypothetical protein VHA82_04050 [Ramlibacter sp.]|uniref:hypothetical protein n=1 Tax=Ramlibacter sp. TaxID=1917967 RepID=UPI002BDD503D|nr:hypothetical protein [Ramlibacter sp.]HVZ42962.1 hypothetical protein [Ramlibacter sp.]